MNTTQGQTADSPQPFEMNLPWEDYAFSRRFYDVVHDWGIPTEKEVAFIVSYLKSPESRVLDMACGGGRHAIALAERGYEVTANDIGGYPLDLARSRAADLHLHVNFVQENITSMSYKGEFDVAFLICGQIGHFSPEDSLAVFRCAADLLVKGGIFLLHLWSFSDDDRSSYSKWYQEKRPLYHPHPSLVRREQYYFPKERIKLIRDLAIDSVTQKRKLFGISEKEYTLKELLVLAARGGIDLIKTYGDFDKRRLTRRSASRIFVFRKPY